MRRNTFPVLAILLAVFFLSVSISVKASHNSTTAAALDRQVAYEAYNEKDKELTNLTNEDNFLALKHLYLNDNWNSEIEDIGENVLTALALNRAALVAAGVNMLKDVYDGASLYDQLTPIRSRRNAIGRKIAGLNLEVPPLKTAWESAKTHHEWHIAQDQGEDPGSDSETRPCGHTYSDSEAWRHNLRDALCGVHSWYSCKKPSFSERQKHQRRVVTTCSHDIYDCQGLSEAEKNTHSHQKLPCDSHYGYPCEADETHGKVITCPRKDGKGCLYGSYYACSEHSHSYPADTMGPCGHTYPPTSASSHSSRPFACSSHTYYACQTPSTSEQDRHKYRTLPCGQHSGRACSGALSSHTQTVSCPTDSNGNSCSYGSYYPCSSHSHSYPSSPSDSNPQTTTCAAGHSYNPNSNSANNHHRTRTCRFSECGQSWQKCTTSITPICNKPYRKRNGLRCYE